MTVLWYWIRTKEEIPTLWWLSKCVLPWSNKLRLGSFSMSWHVTWYHDGIGFSGSCRYNKGEISGVYNCKRLIANFLNTAA